MGVRQKWLIWLLCTVAAVAWSQEKGRVGTLPPITEVGVERLPDLNVARAGHATFCCGGEIACAGGHTTGFVPTPTAEYLAGGKWHTLAMTYPHDDALCVPLTSGKVLLAGGHERNLGIGQTFESELYDPSAHSFGDYGCLDRRRCLSCGAETDSGRVVISGNWYAGDGLCLWDGRKDFVSVKPVSVGRTVPYVLRISGGDAIVFGSQGIRGQSLGDSTDIVDRLRGEAFRAPLLRQWKPVNITSPLSQCSSGFIGDAGRGDFSYLIVARDAVVFDHLPEQQGRSSGQTALLLVRDTVFSLVPTDFPVPRSTDIGGLISWGATVIADSTSRRAYIPGIDKDKRLYFYVVDYSPLGPPSQNQSASGAHSPARPTTQDSTELPTLRSQLLVTPPLADCGFNVPVLLPDGNLVIAGGNYKTGFSSDNYTPTASVYLIKTSTSAADAAGEGCRLTPRDVSARWIIPGSLLLLLLIVAVLASLAMRRRRPAAAIVEPQEEKEVVAAMPISRICELMERRQLFRNPELKAADVAAALSTNARSITDSIRADRSLSFTQFVNVYRVDYAKRLLAQSPDKSVIEIFTEAGFSSERSFFRSFKDVTGMTTREWLVSK